MGQLTGMNVLGRTVISVFVFILFIPASAATATFAVLDRIEEERYAVLLMEPTGAERVLPITALPPNVRPGTWLRWVDGTPYVDEIATLRAQERIAHKVKRLLQSTKTRATSADDVEAAPTSVGCAPEPPASLGHPVRRGSTRSPSPP